MRNRSIPAPRSPARSKITATEQLLPAANQIVTRSSLGLFRPGFNIKGGERVLLLTDTSVDLLVIEAMEKAFASAGARIETIKLNCPPLTDAADICADLFETNFIPTWAWHAVAAHDMTLLATYYMPMHLFVPEFVKQAGGGRVEWFPWCTRFLLEREGLLPTDLFLELNRKVWRKLRSAQEITVTDPLGTDLTLTLGAEYWRNVQQMVERQQRMGYALGGTDLDSPPIMGHLHVYPCYCHARGRIVACNTHEGPIPEVSLTIEDARVVKVEGGGRWGEELRRLFEYLKGIAYPGCPGAGVNWLEELTFGVDVTAARDPDWDRYFGSARAYAWMESRRRSGVLHMAVGISMMGPAGPFVERTGLPLVHRDHEFYFADVYVDGEKLIDAGHLVLLDDPAVRQVAARFGNPDDLLKEAWIPPVRPGEGGR